MADHAPGERNISGIATRTLCGKGGYAESRNRPHAWSGGVNNADGVLFQIATTPGQMDCKTCKRIFKAKGETR